MVQGGRNVVDLEIFGDFTRTGVEVEQRAQPSRKTVDLLEGSSISELDSQLRGSGRLAWVI